MSEAGCCPKTRQGVAERFLAKKKPPLSWLSHRLLVFKRLLKGLQRDGSLLGAGDEIRTRDSLLGRQVIAPSPLASCRLALLAVLTT